MNDDQKTSERRVYTESVPMSRIKLHELVLQLNMMLVNSFDSSPTHRFEIYHFRAHWSEPQYRILLVPTERSARNEFYRNLSRTHFIDE